MKKDDLEEEGTSSRVGFSSVIVIDHLPVVGQDKYQKLADVIQKMFSSKGEVPIEEFSLPTTEDGKTAGVAFIEFKSIDAAAGAVENFNGFKLDKTHTLSVNFFEDIDRFCSVPDQFAATKTKEYEDRENPYAWMFNDEHLIGDQFVTRQADDTTIYWFDQIKPKQILKKQKWTDTFVSWSPFGTFLVTYHPQGVQIWSGDSWKKISKFEHPGVKLIDFSPSEKYLVTFSPNQKPPLIIWDVKTAKRLKALPAPAEGEKTANVWPFIKWNHNDKFFAFLQKGVLSVFEMPSFKRVEKKSLMNLTDIQDFCWSPSKNFISCWTPENENIPARIVVTDITSSKEKTHAIMSVNDCKFHWQNQGDFLCVKVDRYKKTKKTAATNFELFSVSQKDIPVDVLEFSQQNIVAFSWEPGKKRFAVIHSTEGAQKHDVSIFNVEQNRMKLIHKLEKKSANHLFWSPKGEILVLASMKSSLGDRSPSGLFEFLHIGSELESFASVEHPGATAVDWSPSGLHFTSYVSAWRTQQENGYTVWTCYGKTIYQTQKEKFYQFLWRPQPPSLMPVEKQKEIKRNLSKYVNRYSQEETEKVTDEKRQRLHRRQQIKKEFDDLMKKKREQHSKESEMRKKIRNGTDSDDESICSYVVQETEVLVKTTIEVLDDQ